MFLLSRFCGRVIVANKKVRKKKVVNVYSHRHYPSDELLFKQFTEKTGIEVNIIKAKADELLQKIEMEGEKLSC